MDRRTLLFFVSVSAAFLFVDLFFKNRQFEARKEWQQEQEAKKSKQLENLQLSVANRVAPAEELPLVTLYADSKGARALARGVLVDQAILASDPGLPTDVYSEGERYERIAWNKGIAIYSKDGSRLSVAIPYELGRFDLQLVPASALQEAQVTLAEYLDGSFVALFEKPEGVSLALMKQDGTYLPAGVYDAEQGRLWLLDQVSGVADAIVADEPEDTMPPPNEALYVLENQYQQLVFSDIGAALVEVNLPFEGTDVKSIQIDKDIQEQSKANSHFPLQPFYTAKKGSPKGPFALQTTLSDQGYYPLLRRGQTIRGHFNPIEPEMRGLNIVSSYPEVARLKYQVISFEEDRIVFQAKQRHRKITKTFVLSKEKNALAHVLDVFIQVEGDSRGLWLTSGLPEVELVSGKATPSVKVRQTRGKKGEVESISLPKDALTTSSFNPDWVATSNGFFGLILDPISRVDAGYMVQAVSGVEAPTRLSLIDQDLQRFKAGDYPAYNVMLPLNVDGKQMHFRAYMGPFSGTTLASVDAKVQESGGANPDYLAARSYHGWFSWLSEPIAKFLFFLMQLFYRFTHSWAASIVLLTVATRLLLFPLNTWSMRSIRKTQKLAPLVKEIQKKYKKDPNKMQMEIMSLYRKHNANPVVGCLPMILQFPFIIGMFDLIRSSFALRGAPFIPGWIDDLASPDVLFSWGQPLPFIGTEFHLLPFILGFVMYLQSKLMASPPADPNNLTDAERQQKMMTTIMPVMMIVLFYNFAAGLNIYMLSSTLLGIVQQWYINTQVDEEKIDGMKDKPLKKQKA